MIKHPTHKLVNLVKLEATSRRHVLGKETKASVIGADQRLDPVAVDHLTVAPLSLCRNRAKANKFWIRITPKVLEIKPGNVIEAAV